jgi:hypothetical protein
MPGGYLDLRKDEVVPLWMGFGEGGEGLISPLDNIQRTTMGETEKKAALRKGYKEMDRIRASLRGRKFDGAGEVIRWRRKRAKQILKG